MSATGRLAAPPKPDGAASIETCGHVLPSPRMADTLFYVMVPFLGGLFDAAAMAIIYYRGAGGDVAVVWRLAVSVLAAGLAAHACCACDSLKVRKGACVLLIFGCRLWRACWWIANILGRAGEASSEDGSLFSEKKSSPPLDNRVPALAAPTPPANPSAAPCFASMQSPSNSASTRRPFSCSRV